MQPASSQQLSKLLAHKAGDDFDELLESEMTKGPPTPAEVASSQLVDAAVSGDLSRISSLVKDGVDINAHSPQHEAFTALHAAAERGQVQAVSLLLELKADVNKPLPPDVDGIVKIAGFKVCVNEELNWSLRGDGVMGYHTHTVLHRAALYGRKDVIQLLIDAKADLTAGDYADRWPIDLAIIAIRKKRKNVIDLFFKSFIASDLDDQKLKHLLLTLIFAERFDLVQKLLEKHKINGINTVKGLLHDAVKNRQVKSVRYLLEQKVDIEERFEDRTPLEVAVSCQEFDAVKMLIEAKADARSLSPPSKDAALYEAATRGDLEATKFWLAVGADPNKKNEDKYSDGETPLHAAVSRRRENVVQLLVEAKADLTAENNACEWPIDLAIADQELLKKPNPLINLFFQKFIDSDLDEPKLKHLLLKFISTGLLDLARKLVEKNKINVNAVKWGLLYAAAKNGQVESVRYLLEQKVDLAEHSKEGSPLDVAVSCGQFNVVKVLLEAKVDIRTVPSAVKDAALYKSAELGDLEATKFWLAEGANPEKENDKDVMKLTPLKAAEVWWRVADRSKKSKYPPVIAALKAHIATLKGLPPSDGLGEPEQPNVTAPQNSGGNSLFDDDDWPETLWMIPNHPDDYRPNKNSGNEADSDSDTSPADAKTSGEATKSQVKQSVTQDPEKNLDHQVFQSPLTTSLNDNSIPATGQQRSQAALLSLQQRNHPVLNRGALTPISFERSSLKTKANPPGQSRRLTI